MRLRDKLSAVFAAIAGKEYHSKAVADRINRLEKQNLELESRYFEGASQDRLSSDWGTTITSADAELRNDLGALRSRWRELERDNGTGARYLRVLVNNVIGPDGIQLSNHATDPSGKLDVKANTIVENAWQKWGHKKRCTISKLYSWRACCDLALRSAARDGSVLCQVITGAEADNEFGFALKPMEGDHLDRFYSGYAPNGNEVRLGVEYDKDSWGQRRKVVAYWITPRHPGDFIGYSGNYTRRRVPSAEVVHLFWPTRFEQSEGVPWGTAGMAALNHLGKYTEAEMVAARMGACVQDYIQLESGEEYQGDQKDANGQPLTDMQPGAIKVLPKGAKVVSNDPKHPNTAFGDFVKEAKRDVAGGLGVDFESLTNNREAVNYSSIRAGMLDTRDTYKCIQDWFVENFVQEVFDRWLPYAFLSGQLDPLPFSKFDKFNAPTWVTRKWDWVDPLKDQQANKLAQDNLWMSPQEIIRARGSDPDKVLNEIEQWKQMVKAKGLEMPVPEGAAPKAKPEDAKEPEDEDPKEDE